MVCCLLYKLCWNLTVFMMIPRGENSERGLGDGEPALVNRWMPFSWEWINDSRSEFLIKGWIWPPSFLCLMHSLALLSAMGWAAWRPSSHVPFHFGFPSLHYEPNPFLLCITYPDCDICHRSSKQNKIPPKALSGSNRPETQIFWHLAQSSRHWMRCSLSLYTE